MTIASAAAWRRKRDSLARDPDVVLAPDFAFIENSRLLDPNEDAYLPLVPNLVMETRSPGDRGLQVAEQVRLWLSFGVSVVIDANPGRRTLTVHRPDSPPISFGDDDTVTLPGIFPGFSLELSGVFRF